MRYNQITPAERSFIWKFKIQGDSLRQIAMKLNRSPSTISRELRRNSSNGMYYVKKAQEIADARKQNSSRNKRITEHLINTVTELLHEKWSPEQISYYLLFRQKQRVSSEWIYKYIKKDRRAGGKLYRLLRRKQRKVREKRNDENKQGNIRNRKMIDDRPKIVDKRSRTGDWEIDTVSGHNNKNGTQSVVTINERRTGFVLIGKVASRSSENVSNKAIELLMPYRDFVHTITADNGKEFSQFEKIEKAVGSSVYFAHPYHAWERGSNENVNGLIRQYLPKGTPFDDVTQEDCDLIYSSLNNRPRKRLGFKTPLEVFSKRRLRKE